MRILCIDIGGTFIKTSVLDGTDEIVSVKRIKTPENNLKDLLDIIENLYREQTGIDGIAISAPGIIDVSRGYMFTGGTLEYIRNFPMRDAVKARCDGIFVTLENDAKAAAVAELFSGTLRGVKNAVVLTLGTAIGGTVIVDGKILRGTNLFAGEMSYAIFRDAPQKWGNGSADMRMWGFHAVPSQICREYGEKGISSEEIIKRMENGEVNAERAVRKVARELAVLIHNIQCYFDPEVIAIGGGVSVQKNYIKMVQEEVQKLNAILNVVPLPEIRTCKYYNNANLIGAYYCFINHYEQRKLKEKYHVS